LEIYINNEKINFELENEKNVLEVVNAISVFASKSEIQHFITAIFIDNKEYSYADEKNLIALSVDKVEKIEIITSDIYGISTLSLEQIEKFLSLLYEIITSQKWDEGYDKIFETMDWMKEGVKQIVAIFGHEKNSLVNEKISFFDSFEKLKAIFSGVMKNDYPLSKELQKKAIELKDLMLENVKHIKSNLRESNNYPDKKAIYENINTLLEEIEEIIPKLSNVPILFQTGEDQESMDIIKRLAGLLEKSIGLFVIFKESFKLYPDKYTVKEVSFEEFFHVLTDHLKELMSAIENKDSVMIGDLLEYEFVPNVEEIKNILLKIKQEAYVKAN
jgi:hypothetical protein